MTEPTMQLPTAPKRAAVAFVLVTVLLDVMALGLVIPVLPKLVESMAGSTQRAALIFGVFGTAWALMQFIFSFKALPKCLHSTVLESISGRQIRYLRSHR